MTQRGFMLIMLGVVCAAVSCARLGPAADTPRWAEGLVEPTTAEPASSYASQQERLTLIQKAAAHRIELLGKLPPPTVLCWRVPDGSVEVDGVLADAEWEGATVLTDFRLSRELTPATLQTRAMVQWDSRYLYFGFDSEDIDVICTITVPDGEFWREDTVEVFIDANGDEMSYVEFEVSPTGLLYDAAIADYRPEIDWPPDYGHLDIELGIRHYGTRDTRAAAVVRGTLNDPSDTDDGWSCELAVSWQDIARGTNVRRVPPRDGDAWRVGLYRINVNSDPEAAPTEYGAWNPTTSWYHVPWLFGRLVFVE